MTDNTPRHTGQMTGQMFRGADFFTAAAEPPFPFPVLDDVPPIQPPPDLKQTTFMAVQMDDVMLRWLRQRIAPVFPTDGKGLVPTCWYEPGLEAPYYFPNIRVVGEVNNFAKLQILLLEVGGERLRKDGVPFHTIWSYDGEARTKLVRDSNYEWPVKICDESEPMAFEAGRLSRLYDLKTTTVQSTRVLSTLELRAEKLAQEAYAASQSASPYSCNDFDFYPVDMKLCYLSNYYNPLRRVEHDNHRRRALEIGW